jgi:vacuolar iron transporter family protein
MAARHQERHRHMRSGWLRAAVLGANDGIVSIASLVLGVAASHASHRNMLLAGVSGLAAGAMSMAAGEYVSVRSQADTESADIERERRELNADAAGEHRELTSIYVRRGLEPALAEEVAAQLTAHDALGAHVRDELGIVQANRARPLQAACASFASFSAGAAFPLIVAAFAPQRALVAWIAGASLACLAFSGGGAARAGGADVKIGALRVMFWGALAMAVTTAVGSFANSF